MLEERVLARDEQFNYTTLPYIQVRAWRLGEGRGYPRGRRGCTVQPGGSRGSKGTVAFPKLAGAPQAVHL
jgi:hypothetical protein